MFDVPLVAAAFEEWHCPNGCSCRETIPALPAGATRYHNCPRLHQLAAPLVRVGMDVSVEAIEREDYLNGETQAMGDDGKAYMAVTTRYADGRNDLAVNAGLAHASMRALWAGRAARSGPAAGSATSRRSPSSPCRRVSRQGPGQSAPSKSPSGLRNQKRN